MALTEKENLPTFHLNQPASFHFGSTQGQTTAAKQQFHLMQRLVHEYPIYQFLQFKNTSLLYEGILKCLV